MNFRSALIDLALVRTDGGTQVREALDQEYVAELLALWEDNRQRNLPPIIVYCDEAGEHWLADGFHRHAAAQRATADSILAEVRHGSVDMARLYAAGANTRNGMRLNSGDKKRAILLADKTSRELGKPMGVREIARLVGCDHAHVVRVLGGEVVTSHHVVLVTAPRNGKASVESLWLRVDAALRSDPNKSSVSHARDLGCDERVVRARRAAIGLPPLSRGHHRLALGEVIRQEIATQIAASPSASNATIANQVGAGKDQVSRVRRELESGQRMAPSAPVNPKREDPRDKAEVIQKRPPAERPAVDPWIVDMLQRCDRATAAQRQGLLAALERREREEMAG